MAPTCSKLFGAGLMLVFFWAAAYLSLVKFLSFVSIAWPVFVLFSCVEKKPAEAVKPIPAVPTQNTATELPAIVNDDQELANQLRDPTSMLTLEGANALPNPGNRPATQSPTAVEIPRPTSAVPSPPLPPVVMPEVKAPKSTKSE